MDRAKMMSDIEVIEELGRGVIGEDYCAIELRAYVAQMFPEAIRLEEFDEFLRSDDRQTLAGIALDIIGKYDRQYPDTDEA